jgi:hypothetical protein
MDFIDSYGYDQVNVDPVRHVNYDDSEFSLFRSKQKDPSTRKMHEMEAQKKKYQEYLKNPPPYSKRGMEKYNERRKIKENIEDILRPYSRDMCKKDNVRDHIAIKGNNLSELEENLARIHADNANADCKDCRMTKKCKECSKSKMWFGETSDTNLFLLVLVVVLTAFCVIQYVNTQTINATLMGMINGQKNPPPWLRGQRPPEPVAMSNFPSNSTVQGGGESSEYVLSN